MKTKFRALVAPDQMFRVGEGTHKFVDGVFETEDAEIIAALSSNSNVEVIVETSVAETPVEPTTETPTPTKSKK